MGGKSKSSTSQSSQQTTVQPDVSGLVTGDNVQGEDINQAATVIRSEKNLTIGNIVVDQIPDGVAAAFNALINLVGNTVETAADAGRAAIESANQATQTVAQRTETATQPEVSTVNKLIPVAIILALGVAATAIFKR